MRSVIDYQSAPPDRYRAAWRSYTIRAVALFGNMFLGVGVLIAVSSLAEVLLSKSAAGTIFGVLPLCWVALHLILGWWYTSFRCPRCGHKFHLSTWLGLPYGSPFATKCLYCRLPKYAPMPPDEAAGKIGGP
jgi:hypothetical protein